MGATLGAAPLHFCLDSSSGSGSAASSECRNQQPAPRLQPRAEKKKRQRVWSRGAWGGTLAVDASVCGAAVSASSSSATGESRGEPRRRGRLVRRGDGGEGGPDDPASLGIGASGIGAA